MSAVSIPLKDLQRRDIGAFVFDPADAGLMERIDTLLRELPGITTGLYGVCRISANGTARGIDGIILRDVEQRLYSAVDKAFGAGTAAGIFKTMRPFAVVNNRFWCENLAWLCAIAQERIQKGEQDGTGTL